MGGKLRKLSFGPAIFAYGAAVLAVILAAVLRIWLAGPLIAHPFIPFFFATLLVVAFAGPGPGIVATVGSALTVTCFFLEPIASLGIAAPELRLLIFVTLGLAMSLVAEWLRRKSNTRMEVAATRSQQAAREALIASEQQYRTLFETSRDGIASVNMNGQILQANQAFQDLVGYTLEELKSLTYRDLTPPQWHEMEEAIIEEHVLPRGDSGEYEKSMSGKTGSCSRSASEPGLFSIPRAA
jgi:PAS domain S-box-containing protein